MRYGFVYPGGEALAAAECAAAAEQAGWDGFFVWDPVWGVDAWVTLTAAAMRTSHIRLGTMITPVSRRRPWKLASETATVDRLSGGRLILGVGLGAIETGFTQFGEETDRKQRAELLDEGLDILTGLWRGQPFAYDGKHYHVRETEFVVPPPPLQTPRIPIWVVGAWPRPKSMQRAARYDGLIPTTIGPDGQHRPPTLEDLRAMRAYIRERHAEPSSYEIIMEGETPGDDPERAAATVAPLAEAGASWWLEARWQTPGSVWDAETQALLLDRIRQGPPRIS